MPNESGAQAARLGDYFVLLRRQWLALLLCLAIGIGAAMAYLQWAPKEYRSQTSVLVSGMETDASTDRGSAINLDTEAQLVTSTQTTALAAERLGLPAGEVADRVGVSVPPNTEILDISYVAGSAADAQRGSLAFAESYLEQRQATGEEILDTQADAAQGRIDAVEEELDATLEEADDLPEDSPARGRAEDEASRLSQQLSTLTSNQNRLRTETLMPGRIVTQPRLPSSPSSPNPLITIAAGMVLGLLLGVGVAALRHRADDVIRTPEDLFARTRLPVATVLSTRLHAGQVAVLPPLSADGRGYARLRNVVTTSLEESDRRVVLVTGVRRGSGPVAANLAASLARAGEEVFLVCADVFGPTATALFPGRPAAGLAEVLAGEAQVDDVTRRLPAIPNLRVLGPGLDPDRADALLQTRSPRKLIDPLLRSGAYVVIEAPPTTDSTDAQTLANVAEIAVLVVESGRTSAREVVEACALLESMHTAVLGGVIVRYGRDSEPHPQFRSDHNDEFTADTTDAAPGAQDDVAADDRVPGNGATGVRPNGNGAMRAEPEAAVPPAGGRPQLTPPGPVKPAPR